MFPYYFLRKRLFFDLDSVPLNYARSYFRSETQIKSFFFCVLLTYSYLCRQKNKNHG